MFIPISSVTKHIKIEKRSEGNRQNKVAQILAHAVYNVAVELWLDNKHCNTKRLLTECSAKHCMFLEELTKRAGQLQLAICSDGQ